MNDYYVYCYFDGETPIYIGKGHRDRDVQHLQSSRISCRLFHPKLRKMQRDGLNPRPVRLLEGLTEREAWNWEVFFIAAIGRKDLGTGPLLNGNAGGEGGANLTIEGRQRIAEAQHYRRPPEGRYKGVHCCGAVWIVRFDNNALGPFTTPEEAALVYNEAVEKFWGGRGYKNPVIALEGRQPFLLPDQLPRQPLPSSRPGQPRYVAGPEETLLQLAFRATEARFKKTRAGTDACQECIEELMAIEAKILAIRQREGYVSIPIAVEKRCVPT